MVLECDEIEKKERRIWKKIREWDVVRLTEKRVTGKDWERKEKRFLKGYT